MLRRSLLLSLIILFSCTQLAPASDSVEALVKRGLDAYSKEGATAAITSWVKGSYLENDKKALSQADTLKQVEGLYGSYEGYEILKQQEVTKRNYIVYFVIYYTKGPLYCSVNTYKTKKNGWILTNFIFHSDIQMVFPESVYENILSK